MARAVELAAGESRRMGAPVEQVAVVLGHRAAVIRQAVPADPKVPVCVNERYPERMLTSHARGGRPGAGIVGGGEDHAVPGGGPVPRGDVSVYIKSLLPAPVLLVIGAGHVGQMVAQLGAMAGRVLCGPFAAELGGLDLGPQHYVVLMTSGRHHDRLCLEQLIGADVAYLGMIGSRTRVETLFAALEAEGSTGSGCSGCGRPSGSTPGRPSRAWGGPWSTPSGGD